jgi:RNA polymerase sigma-70 factor (ECF subfamily)
MSADTSTVAGLLTDLASDLDAHFEQLVLLYQRPLYNFAFRMTCSSQDAEEVTQDAFVRAYRALQGYDPDRIRELAVQAWLYRITHNLVRNRSRRIVPRSSSIDQDGAAPIEDPGISVAETYEQIETSHEIAELLTRLPDKYRAAVVLRFINDLPYAEIAETLEQPVGTVKSNVHRGIAMLRQALDTAPVGAR